MVGGQLDIIIDQASSAISIVKGGNVRAYAVTAKQRLALRAGHPDRRRSRAARLPRLDLAGRVGAEGHAEGDHRKLNAAIAGALADPAVQKRLAEIGQEMPSAEQMTPAGFGAFHKAEMDKWTPIIKAANIKPEGT